MIEKLETLTEEETLARMKSLAMPKTFVKETLEQLNDYVVRAGYAKPQGENGKQYQKQDDPREHY